MTRAILSRFAAVIPVGDIKFGEIDAKNEVFDQDRAGTFVFQNSFQIPPGIKLDSLLVGSKYYIYGQKGCGKTALLLYLKKKLEENGAKARSVLFKSGITEPERQKIASGRGFDIVDPSRFTSIEYDYKLNWLWYIYRNILRMITKDQVYQKWEIIESLQKIVGVHSEVSTSTLSDLNTNRIKAHAKAGVNAGPFTAEIGAEIEAVFKTGKNDLEIDVLEIVERHLPNVVFYPNKRTALLFDELELFWNKPDQRQRDLYMIRDLLYAASRANHNIGATNASIVVYAAVRAEVLHEVNRVGPEISRDVDDFGVRVNWNVRVDDRDQPILKIVEAKINSSELDADELPTGNVWVNYFPKEAFGRNFQKYLLDIAMYRPRNIVNLLSLAQAYKPNDYEISFEAIDESQSEFSKRSWREVEEELLGEYTSDRVRAIKALLTGFKHTFMVKSLIDRLNKLGAIDTSITKAISTEENLVEIVKTLYRVGALGNRYYVTGRGNKKELRFGWIFRDNQDPVIDREFIVHESLRKTLQLSFRDG
ncbi:MAG: hypothetical protein WC816_14465 [Sphingomonas sp.]